MCTHLLQLTIQTTDVFSLHVEGAQMIILQSIDWKHLDIDVFKIETDQHRQDILTFMKSGDNKSTKNGH
jgi:hypothetical protein